MGTTACGVGQDNKGISEWCRQRDTKRSLDDGRDSKYVQKMEKGKTVSLTCSLRQSASAVGAEYELDVDSDDEEM